MKIQEYDDPYIKLLGGCAIVGLVVIVFVAAVYWSVVEQIDSQVGYCPNTKTDLTVRNCKEVR